MTQSIKEQIKALIGSPEISETDYRKAKAIYINGDCQILSRSARGFDVLVFDEDDVEVNILYSEEESLRYFRDGKPLPWDSYGLAALMQIDEELEKPQQKISLEGKRYSREGMVKRVLEERKAKALKAKYTIRFADNIYGEHLLTNEKGTRYKITLRDFENETGYIDNPDLKTNKLGTTKHIMFAFTALRAQPETFNNLRSILTH
jgi:tRNA G37 N-methylase Trm5